MKRTLGLAVCAVALTSCSVRPDGSNGLSRAFDLPGIGYDVAYHRAVDFMQACHKGWDGFSPTVTNNQLFPDTKTAEVSIAMGGGSGITPERIFIAASPTGTKVKIVAIHRLGKWDSRELDAAQRSIQGGTIICR